MVPYRPPALRFPVGSRALGQTFDQMFGWSPVAGDAFRLFFHTSTAYLGVSVGLTSKSGFLRYFGWFLGLGQGIAAICDAASLVQRALGTHSSDRVPAPGAPAEPGTLPVAPPPATVLGRPRIVSTTALPA